MLNTVGILLLLFTFYNVHFIWLNMNETELLVQTMKIQMLWFEHLPKIFEKIYIGFFDT